MVLITSIGLVHPGYVIPSANNDRRGCPSINFPTKQNADQLKAACWNSSVSAEKHPYHASIAFDCKGLNIIALFGVIISDQWILAATYLPSWTELGDLSPTVYVGSDEHGEGGSEHSANFIRIGSREELSLFKLMNPITFGPRVQPIEIIGSRNRVKSHDMVTLTAVQQIPFTSLNRKIMEAKFIVMSSDECINLLTDSHPHEADEQKAACWNSSVSIEKYPYHASIAFNCNGHEIQSHFGVIISDHYILAATYSPPWVKSENHLPIVYVGSDEHGNGGTVHKAILITIGLHRELSLFKLRNPITFGPRAQPIHLVKTGNGTKTKDVVTLTAVQQIPFVSLNRKVTETNVTVIGEEECRSLLSKSRPNDVSQCKGYLWVYHPLLNCSVWNKSVLTLRGQLAAIEIPYNSMRIHDTDSGSRTIDRYLDIAHYRALIRDRTGI
ncbi:hypothetical protein QAD02_018337 [Eretmocerus hayati]|uniref:Uncharacterized protein n=1 Tax=Eretmocerus hayati TaxID=131215 RepID=A0ACC2PL98_9HYME|nr:hypothetical protein QAD02_018337 [Eretmocerus hayati]